MRGVYYFTSNVQHCFFALQHNTYRKAVPVITLFSTAQETVPPLHPKVHCAFQMRNSGELDSAAQ
jgi:hypothetical protein